MQTNKYIIVIAGGLGDIYAALSFSNDIDYTQVQALVDNFKAVNKEWQYSELVEAICAEFDAEEIMVNTVYA